MKLLATALLGFLAVTVAEPEPATTRHNNIIHCKDFKLVDGYTLEAKCGGVDYPVTTKLDLSPCILNKNERMRYDDRTEGSRGGFDKSCNECIIHVSEMNEAHMNCKCGDEHGQIWNVGIMMTNYISYKGGKLVCDYHVGRYNP